MCEPRVANYFVVAGVAPDSSPLDRDDQSTATHRDPVVDIAIINRTAGELPPPGFTCVEATPGGWPANLNHGSLRSPEMYLCYRRDHDRPPLTDIGVLYECKEKVMSGCEVLYTTPYNRPANVNNSNSSRVYVTYRRAQPSAASDMLVVTDVCIVLANKGETAPHAFCMIEKTLNKGMMGSDIYLCYKKSTVKTNVLMYKPSLLGRYPAEDYEDSPLPPTVSMFCLPMGASVECWPSKAHPPRPIFSTFVLTGAYGQKMFGAAVMFYAESDKELTDDEQRTLGLIPPAGRKTEPLTQNGCPHESMCVCLLSDWPFFDTFKKFLSYLYHMSVSGEHAVPLERYICHFLNEVPFPSPKRPRILVQLSDRAVILSQPEDTPLPKSGASFIKMLQNLGAENSMMLLLCTLVEHKILIHSLRPAVLTSVAEASTAMIFPFHWQCPYIPLCPLELSEVLHAPCPFTVGVDSRYFELFDPPPDVTYIDLDTNNITLCDDKRGLTPSKSFPKKAMRQLRATLERLFEQLCSDASSSSTDEAFQLIDPIEQDLTRKRKELEMEIAIQEAFLRFMASILKGYSHYLLPITQAPSVNSTDLGSRFDTAGFLKSRERAYHKFYSLMMKTQSFTRFIEERSFVSDKDAGLAFFDECIERVDEAEPLIEIDHASSSERTVFVTPPEPIGLPEGVTYSYTRFPRELKPDLYIDKRQPAEPARPHANATPSGVAMASQQALLGSVTKRSKLEIKYAQKTAQQHAHTPHLWAKCVLSHCYSLWFIHLPCYVKTGHSKTKVLRSAFDVLVKMQKAKLNPLDEVCYRVLMQLCSLYNKPTLVLKILIEMKQHGVRLNAITYGYYNKAALESKWATASHENSSAWTKLRHVIRATAQFRRALRRRHYTTGPDSDDRVSHASVDSFLEETGAGTGVGVLEEIGTAGVGETVGGRADGGVGGTGFVHDLVQLDGGRGDGGGSGGATGKHSEEKGSTGGISDRGYNSMTLEDASTMSSLIGSKDSMDSLGGGGVATMPHVIFKEPARPPPMIANTLLCHSVPTKEACHRIVRDSSLTDHCRSSYSEQQQEVVSRAEDTLCDTIKMNGTVNTGIPAVKPTDLPLRNVTSDVLASPAMTPASPKNTILPVMENDPLGLLSPSVVDVTPPKARQKTSGVRRSLVTQLEPFPRSTSRVSPVEEWTPITAQQDSSAGDQSTTTTVAGDRTPTRSSDSLASTLRFAASSFVTKVGELRQTVGATPSRRRGSESSQTRSESEGLLGTDERDRGDYVDEARDKQTPFVSDLLDSLLSLRSSTALRGLADTWHSVADSVWDSWGIDPDGDHMPYGAASSEGDENYSDKGSAVDSESTATSMDGPSGITSSLRSLFEETAMDVEMCSLCRCTACHGLLYDEQVMGSWSADDSNLNTTCEYCKAKVVPFLHIYIKDFRRTPRSARLAPSQSCDSVQSLTRAIRPITSEPCLSRSINHDADNNGDVKPNQFAASDSPSSASSRKEEPLVQLDDIVEPARTKLDLGYAPTESSTDSTCVVEPLVQLDDIMPSVDSQMAPQIPNISLVENSTMITDFLDPLSSPNDERTLLDADVAESASSGTASEVAPLSDKQTESVAGGATTDDGISVTSSLTGQERDMGVSLEPIRVPYLSPLVLRKELETVIDHEGPACLERAHFVDAHPIIFWNMVWYFRRLDIPSHLPGFILTAQSTNTGIVIPHISWLNADSRHVLVRPMWDNPRLHDSYIQPMYIRWNPDDNPLTSPNVPPNADALMLQQIIASIVYQNNTRKPLQLLVASRRQQGAPPQHHSVYRDLLFLCYVALGRDSISYESYNTEYSEMLSSLSPNDCTKILSRDYAPKKAAICCATLFGDLQL